MVNVYERLKAAVKAKSTTVKNIRETLHIKDKVLIDKLRGDYADVEYIEIVSRELNITNAYFVGDTNEIGQRGSDQEEAEFLNRYQNDVNTAKNKAKSVTDLLSNAFDYKTMADDFLIRNFILNENYSLDAIQRGAMVVSRSDDRPQISGVIQTLNAWDDFGKPNDTFPVKNVNGEFVLVKLAEIFDFIDKVHEQKLENKRFRETIQNVLGDYLGDSLAEVEFKAFWVNTFQWSIGSIEKAVDIARTKDIKKPYRLRYVAGVLRKYHVNATKGLDVGTREQLAIDYIADFVQQDLNSFSDNKLSSIHTWIYNERIPLEYIQKIITWGIWNEKRTFYYLSRTINQDLKNGKIEKLGVSNNNLSSSEEIQNMWTILRGFKYSGPQLSEERLAIIAKKVVNMIHDEQ
jgi:hypothetical protein